MSQANDHPTTSRRSLLASLEGVTWRTASADPVRRGPSPPSRSGHSPRSVLPAERGSSFAGAPFSGGNARRHPRPSRRRPPLTAPPALSAGDPMGCSLS
jgi:hypothetical protein